MTPHPETVHRDALATLNAYLAAYLTRAHWARIVGDRDAMTHAVRLARSLRAARRAHRAALECAA